jgi:peptidoglycan/LPS O-acetylase OafA/YrhL
MTGSKRIYFPYLDVIRFVAAFMVVILYSYGKAYEKLFSEEMKTTMNSTWPLLHQFIKNLGFGVDIFFLISGFLITYILLEEKGKLV